MRLEQACCSYHTLKLTNCQIVSPGDKGKEAEPAKATGPVGGVKPGLDQDKDQPLQGPEPLMGVQHLGQVEKGDLTSGDEAVLAAASQIKFLCRYFLLLQMNCQHTLHWYQCQGRYESVPMFG